MKANGWQWLAAMTVVLVDSILILSSRPPKQLPSINEIEHRTKLEHPAAESAAIKMGRTGRGMRRRVKLVIRAGVVVVSFRREKRRECRSSNIVPRREPQSLPALSQATA